MKNLYLLLVISLAFVGCHQVSVGFLMTEEAGYNPDSLVVKSVLDTTAPEVIPNPEWEMFIEIGLTPEQIMDMDVFPTLEIGGGEDYQRVTYDIPWTSVPLEGYEGTQPIYMAVKSIITETGDAEVMKRYLSVRGNGMLSIPVRHEVPAGRYVISLRVWNEGYAKEIEDCFTVIVE